MTKFLFIFFRGLSLFKRFLRSNIMSIIALTGLFIVLHTAFSISGSISKFTESIANFDRIRVYLSVTDNNSVNKIKKELDSANEIDSSLIYYPSDSKEFLVSNAPGVEGVKGLSEEFFPVFIEASVKDGFQNAQKLDDISGKISQLDGVDFVSYGKEWANKMFRAKNAVLLILSVASCLFSFVGALVIYQTVCMALFRYKNEIRVYKMVGGTASFVTLPFVIMSAFITLLCSILSLLVYMALHKCFVIPLEQILGTKLVLPANYIFYFFFFSILVSAIATFFSSLHFTGTKNDESEA